MQNIIDNANKKALEIIQNGQPTLIGLGVAEEVIPGMAKDLFLHAGPPVSWERMSGPLRGAVIAGIMYEGLASTPEEAAESGASGKLRFDP